MEQSEEAKRQERLARRRETDRELRQRKRAAEATYEVYHWTPDFILRNFLIALSIQVNNVTCLLLEAAQMLDCRLDHYSGQPCARELQHYETLMNRRLSDWQSWQPNRDQLAATVADQRAKRGRYDAPRMAPVQGRFNLYEEPARTQALDLSRTATATVTSAVADQLQDASSTTIVTPQAEQEVAANVIIDPIEIKIDPSFGGFEYF